MEILSGQIRPAPVVIWAEMTENNLESSQVELRKNDPKYMYFHGLGENFEKNFISDFGLDSTGAGLDTSPDTRKTPRIDQPRWPGKYHMIIHVHEVLVFWGVCVFLFDCLDRGVFVCCFVWLFRSGCFVWGVVCCCWGGACEDFSFWKAARAICGITNRQN